MASSSYFSTSNQYVKYWIIVDQLSQNIGSNTSSIRVRVQFWRTNSGYQTWGTGTLWCKIDGTWYSASVTPDQKISGTITLFDRTVTVGHNADGTKSVYVSAYIEHNAPLKSSEQGFSVGLSTIPRKSTLSFSDFTFGKSGTITIHKAASGFTHTVKFTCGKYSGTIASGISGGQVEWTPPRSYMDAVPDRTRCIAQLQILTYNGGTYIGESTHSCTIYVPDDVLPSIGDFIAVPVGAAVPRDWGMYVQSKSQCALQVKDARGAYGSAIIGYTIKREGTVISQSATAQTGLLGTQGEVTYEAIVTDSRGRTTSRRVTITVEPYNAPGFADVSSFRCTASGMQSDEGTYVKAKAVPAYTPLGGKNKVSVTYAYRETGGKWSSDTALSGSTIFGSGAISTDRTYEVRYKIVDLLGSHAEYVDHISTAFCLLDLKKGGKGMAIGKVAQKDGHLEIGLIADFMSEVNVLKAGDVVNIGKEMQKTDARFSRVDQCFFYIFQRSWESPNWLAKGAPGLYLMSPTDNPTNSPFPGEWGWMFNMDTVRFAYRNDITNRSASGPLYINTYSKDRWSGWLNELDRSGIGQTVEVGYYKNEWKLATEYYDIGNGRAALDTEYFKTDSQQSTITVKKDGVYTVEFSGTLRSESQNVIVWMKLFVNGSEHRALSNYMYHSGVHMAMNGSWTCELRKGDRLNARLALSTGGTVYATRACFMRVTKIK